MDITNIYETMFVVSTKIDDEAIKNTVSKFTSLIANNGETIKVSEWGKRRLAYTINYMTEGYFVVVAFRSKPEFPNELERLYSIDENIIRSIVVRLEEEPKADEKVEAEEAPVAETVEEVKVEEPAAAAEEETAAPEEPAAETAESAE